MPKHVPQNAETVYRNAKAREAPYRIGDGAGLFMLVDPDGSKRWRWQYARPVTGKRNTLALGDYPTVTAAKARVARDDALRLLSEGIDPGEHRKLVRAAGVEAASNSFKALCLEWLATRESVVAPAQVDKSKARLLKDVVPWLGDKPINAITAPDVLAVMRRIDERGARYTAHKVKSEISQIIRFAIATGRAERDPCPDLRGAIPAPKEIHHAALTKPDEVAALLRAFDAFSGTYPVKCALLLSPLLFARPGELRKAKWEEFDLERGEWRYRVSKTNTDHLVPLARQVVGILQDLHALTGRGEYLFPGGRDPHKPMSDAAVNAALRRMGYDTRTEITGHGFRAMARTILAEELHIKPEVIEHQLAHKVPDTLGTAYNRTKFIKERVKMMQVWADYLDKLKAGADVLPFQRAA
ncbi:MAG: tyrosine-type recombinase/integrase [Pseudomonadota bacterium]|nr:tyrosine-type recombinase/integrase [Pseudomonadota bacterium]